MRKILLALFVLLAVTAVFTFGLVIINETHPFAPGTPLYVVQDNVEQLHLSMLASAADQADQALTLADHRLRNLAQAKEAEAITSAAIEFDQALDMALLKTEALPVAERSQPYGRLSRLLSQSKVVLVSLKASTNADNIGDIIGVIQDKIALLQAADTYAEITAVANAKPAPPSIITAAPVTFLGQDVDHSLYLLSGAHLEADCLACHPTGEYANTPTECSDCHQVLPENSLYPDHFAGTCENCHTVDNWLVADFDHVDVIECESCHTAVIDQLALLPQPHYPNTTCQTCHLDTDDWTVFTYGHEDVTECESCHTAVIEELALLPQAHYPGECMLCHQDVEEWAVFTFDHEDVADNDDMTCESCHEQATPAPHYEGACVRCHTNVEDWNIFRFDHTGYDNLHRLPPNHHTGRPLRRPMQPLP